MNTTESFSLDLDKTNIVPEEHPDLFENLQGNILTGHGRDFARHIFVKFKVGQENAVKAWLHQFAHDKITSAAQQEIQRNIHQQNPDVDVLFANLYLSSLAYSYLGFADSIPSDQSFRQGMANRQAELSDPPKSEWEPKFQEDIDAMILYAMDDDSKLENFTVELVDAIQSFATINKVERGKVIRNTKGEVIEHFGFVDGISNPQYLERKIAPAKTDNFDPNAPLKLILTKDIHGGDFAYGTYVVYRKLAQDVPRWNEEVLSLASSLDIQPALAGAYAVGRFQDGTPVVSSSTALNEPIENDFNYEEDPNGIKCPFHAHIRKTNPRGETAKLFPGTSVESEREHRITRRAISYGPNPVDTYTIPDSDAQPTTINEVGLLFICMQSSIVNQFDFMQASWANANHFIKQNVGQDTVIGQGPQVPSDGQNYPNRWGNETDGFSRFNFELFVRMKGGEYFFAPSIEFLKTV